MFCPECGKMVSEQSVFCPECGTKIMETQAVSPTTQVTRKPTETEVSRRRFHFLEAFTGKVSGGLLGFAVLLFLLPWITVSCAGEKVLTVSGTDLAIGKEIQIPRAFGEPDKQNTREGKVTIAFIAGIVGALAGFLVKAKRAQRIILSVFGGIGTIVLFVLKYKIDTEIVEEGKGIIAVDYHFGFWLTLFLFFAVTVLNVVSLTNVSERVRTESISGTGFRAPPKSRFCGQCGAEVSSNDVFCSECGHALK